MRIRLLPYVEKDDRDHNLMLVKSTDMLTLDVGRSEGDSNGKAAALAVCEVVDLILDAFLIWLSELAVSTLTGHEHTVCSTMQMRWLVIRGRILEMQDECGETRKGCIKCHMSLSFSPSHTP